MSNNAVLARLADRIFNTPLFIHPDKLDTIMSVIGGRIGLDLPAIAFDSAAGLPIDAKRGVDSVTEREVTLAIIPVVGSLVHRTGGLDAMSGMRSYRAIRNDFRGALNDKSIDGIVFDFDSYGGEAHGLLALVDEIYEARSTKYIAAIVNDNAYSAAYAIASACQVVYLSKSAGVGSIGVRAVHADRSAKNEQEGIKYTPLFVGARKNDFSPLEPLTDKASAVMMESLTMHYDLFVATVARNRNMDEKAVRATEAGFYEGENAVTAGLADAVLSWNQAIERIAENIPTGGRFMSEQKPVLQKQLEALFKGSSETEIVAALEPLGYSPATAKADGEAAIAAAKKESRSETLNYVAEVIGLCKLAGHPQMAAALIAKEASVADAKAALVEAQANQSQRETVLSTVGADAGSLANPLVENARSRAEQRTN